MIGATGNRVAVEFNKDEWYIGTITKLLPKTGYKVSFDDGESSTADPKKMRIVLVDPKTKKVKRPLSLVQMRLLKPESKTKTVPAKDKKAAPVPAKPAPAKDKPAPAKGKEKPAPVKGKEKTAPPAKPPVGKGKPAPAAPKVNPKLAPIKTGPVPPAPPMVNPRKPVQPPSTKPVNIREANSCTAEEKMLKMKLGHPDIFTVTSRPDRKLDYLKKVWADANKKLFASKLPPCNIRLSKDTGLGFRRRGSWTAQRNEITISPRLFNGQEHHVLTTLVHEMCHQAVSKINNVVDRTKGGHGAQWETWMRHCGLTPSRYSIYDNSQFATEDQKKELAEQKLRKEQADLHVKNQKMQRASLTNGNPAQYFDPKTNQWVKGLLACKHDRAGKRWAFVKTPNSTSFGIIPSEWFYAVPEKERPTYLTDSWTQAAGHIVKYYSSKAEVRATRGARRRGGLFGGLF